MSRLKKITIGAALLPVFMLPEAQATTYRFTVSCQNQKKVVEWNTGAIDPGKEYLRVATGTNHPNCTVGDFNPATDSAAPKEELSGGGGILAGIPPIQILKDIFGW